MNQTAGKLLTKFTKTTGDPKDYHDKLKAMAEKRVHFDRVRSRDRTALGMSSGGRIRLVPGLSPAEEFSVLAHELAHEMLHHPTEGTPLPKTVRETQAEAVAFVVSRGIGLETNNAAADYIALYNGDKKTLAESLAVIQATSARILDELLPFERTRHEPAAERNVPSSPPVASTPSEKEPSVQEHPSPVPEEPVVWDR